MLRDLHSGLSEPARTEDPGIDDLPGTVVGVRLQVAVSAQRDRSEPSSLAGFHAGLEAAGGAEIAHEALGVALSGAETAAGGAGDAVIGESGPKAGQQAQGCLVEWVARCRGPDHG